MRSFGPYLGALVLTLGCGLNGYDSVGEDDGGTSPDDPTLSTGASVASPELGPRFVAADAAVDRTGRILVVGSVAHRGARDFDFAVLRYSEQGLADDSFGEGGLVTVDLGSDEDFAHAIVVLADGTIAVAGETSRDDSYDFAVLRLLEDGSRDASFGSDGIAVHALSSAHNRDDRAVALLADGQGGLFVGGHSNTAFPGWDDFAVAHLLPDGSLDPAFGNSGTVVHNPTGNDFPSFLLADQGGGLVMGGTGRRQIVLSRYVDGALDAAFGTDGSSLSSSMGRAFVRGFDAALDGDGRVIVVGEVGDQTSAGGGRNGAIMRFNADGSVDSTFGDAGLSTLAIDQSELRSVLVLESGELLVGGTARQGHEQHGLVVLLDSTGAPVSSFGDQGTLTFSHDGGDRVFELIDEGQTVLIAAQTGTRVALSRIDLASPRLSVAGIDLSAPFLPSTDDQTTLALAAGPIDTTAISRSAPLQAGLLLIEGAVTIAPQTPTALFVRSDVVRFSPDSSLEANGERGHDHGVNVPGAGGAGGSGGGSGAQPHSGHGGTGGRYGGDGGAAVGGTGGRGWASVYANDLWYGLGGRGGSGSGCCPPTVFGGEGGNGAGGGGGGNWTNEYTQGGGGGGGLVVIVANRVEGPGALKALGGDSLRNDDGGRGGGGGGGVVWVAARSYDGQLTVDVAGGSDTTYEPGRPGTARIFELTADDRLVPRDFDESW